jgi:hypothetical protein
VFRKLFEMFEAKRGAGPRAAVEGLEDRRLLSAAPVLAEGALVGHQNASGTHAGITTVAFSAAPTAVRDGLNAIVPSGVSIGASDTVYVKAVDSTRSLYTVKVTPASGATVRLSVDENGLPAGSEKVTFGQLSAGPGNDAAIATAIQGLAPSGMTIPATQAVVVRTGRDGTSTYSLSVRNTNGTVTKITVDSTGTAVSTGQHGAGASANTQVFSAAPAAVQNGLKAIAPSGTTIDPSQTVTIQKLSATVTLYSVTLTDNSSGGFGFAHGRRITVDQNGLPGGEETVQFSQLQAGPSNDQGIASGLQNLAPAGVTIDGAADVRVRTFNGVTTYSVTVNSGTGTTTTISVDSSGAAVTPSTPSATTTTFGAAPGPVQAGLNAIAPSGTTIDSGQTVYVLTLGGISYYSLNLNEEASVWGFGRQWGERITVDQNGLPSGNQQITFGQLQNGPANDKAIASAIQGLAPAGVTIAGTQSVQVRTSDGTTTFTVDVTDANNTTTEITVDASGTAVSTPGGGGGFGFGGGEGGGFGHHGFGGGMHGPGRR